MSSRGLLIYVEGDTEIEFYKAIVKELEPVGQISVKYQKILYRNAKGIGNFQNKAARVFKNQILLNNPDTVFDVALCYDTDVFKYASKPPVNWNLAVKDLKEAGANKVYHIKADRSLEDWFLLDIEGILKYLHLPLDTKIPKGSGLQILESLFKRANKVYVKGVKVEGLIDHLDIAKIIKALNQELDPLIVD